MNGTISYIYQAGFLARNFLVQHFLNRFIISNFRQRYANRIFPKNTTKATGHVSEKSEFFPTPQPGIIQIHKRIMNDVQGIGYISQEFANYGSPFICRFSGGTQVNKDREKNNGTYRVINTIHPRTSYRRYVV